VKLGGTLRDATKVVKVDAEPASNNSSIIEVECQHTIDGTSTVEKCSGFVACPGPWAAAGASSKLADVVPGMSLFASVPAKIICLPVHYYKIKEGMTFPRVTFCDMFAGGYSWGIPDIEYPGLVKVRIFDNNAN
jgi:hypothetical protein